jgi:ABC-2 type transport system permease protein
MTMPSNAAPDFLPGSPGLPPVGMHATRPLYWSVRRELWENRSIYIAPVIVAGMMLFGFLISMITLPHRMRTVMALDAAKQRAMIELPYDMAAGLVIVTAFIVGFFYCLDALYGERRDRSILFWKSLPVSDRTTVLSKASIPLVVLPLINFAVIVVTQSIMLMLNTVALLGNPSAVAALWTHLKFVQLWIALLYALAAIALWHAPIYAWLLFVSGWARRATFIWAVLPFVAICVFEKVAFNTNHFALLLKDRASGWFLHAFIPATHGGHPLDPLAGLTPGNLLSAPSLWLGLLLAAAFFAAAVRMRRNREPI